MPVAREFSQVRPNLAIWQTYDKTAKADLFSSALTVQDGVFVIDPIEIADHPLDQLTGMRPIVDMLIAPFMYCAMDQITSILAKSTYVYGGQARLGNDMYAIDDPLYDQTVRVARRLAEHEWMVITGTLAIKDEAEIASLATLYRRAVESLRDGRFDASAFAQVHYLNEILLPAAF